jgi:tRNA 2-thiocytidine biosynthesis protein TtcA
VFPIRRHDAFAKVCHLAGRAVAEFDMIRPQDRVVVGVSGGKDSLVLLHVLERLRSRAPVPFELVPVLVDMGFARTRPEAVRSYCAGHGWSLRVVSLPGRELLRDKGAEDRPCSLCSRLRRGQLHAVAEEVEAGVIALGQHLDDLCVSLLMSLFRGGGLKTMGPSVAADSGSKRLIRPLCLVQESLIVEAAGGFGFPDAGACDFLPGIEAHGDRAYLERLLGSLDLRFAGVRNAMLRSMRDLRPAHLLDKRFL